MAVKDMKRLGPFGVRMHRPLLWMFSLRTSKNMWIVRAQATRGWREWLFGVLVFRDEDDELTVEVGLLFVKWTLHQCELLMVPSEQLRGWAALDEDGE